MKQKLTNNDTSWFSAANWLLSTFLKSSTTLRYFFNYKIKLVFLDTLFLFHSKNIDWKHESDVSTEKNLWTWNSLKVWKNLSDKHFHSIKSLRSTSWSKLFKVWIGNDAEAPLLHQVKQLISYKTLDFAFVMY